MFKVPKKILLASFGLIVLGALVFHFTTEQNQYFSSKSLQELQSLNSKHKVYIADLFGNDNSPLQKELLFTNVLQDNRKPSSLYKGLIAYAHNPTLNKEGIFLLNTTKSFSTEELSSLAKEYQNSIPEFINVEVDQDIHFTEDSAVTSVNDTSKAATTGTFLKGATGGAASKSPQVLIPEQKVISPLALLKSLQAKKLKRPQMNNVRVALIDSGIDSSHEIFSGKKVDQGWNILNNDSSMYDDVGHGTHIAGIIVSESPTVELIPYKVKNKEDGKLSDVIKALNKAIDDKVDIVNMSFGFSEKSYSLEQVIKKAKEQNILMIAAAGNHNDSKPFYPAAYDEVIAVAAIDDAYQKTESSNYGDWVDIASNGYQIYSSLPNNLYGRKSGTSQATGVASGVFASLLAKSEISKTTNLDELKTLIEKHAQHFGEKELYKIPIVSLENN